MATRTINLWDASEADLNSLDGTGQVKANSILQLREKKEDFNFYDVADVTQTEPSKWVAWSRAGIVCIKKLEAVSSANPPLQLTSNTLSTTELNSTLMEMNKNIKLLHDEVSEGKSSPKIGGG